MAKGDTCRINNCVLIISWSGTVCRYHRHLKDKFGSYDATHYDRNHSHSVSRVHDFPHSRKNFFYSKTTVPNEDGCMLWTGSTNSRGYGQVSHYPLNTVAAHRYSYALHYGPFDAALWVLHRCDNPLCVAPEHLFLGDRKANMQDCASKGRLNIQKRKFK